MSNTIADNAFLSTLSSTSQEIGSQVKANKDSNELGQSAFLELMITQLENQDPLSPQENSEFIAQLAQFSSVEGLEKLNSNFDSFASNFVSNQALQASSLVGSSVSVPANTSRLTEESVVGGIISLPSSTSDLSLNIYNEQGALVEEIPLGQQSAGDIVFRWDGRRIEVNGELNDFQAANDVSPGEYRFEAIASQNGEPQQLETALTANVNSVTVGDDGQLVLNLSGIGAVNIDDVKQFN